MCKNIFVLIAMTITFSINAQVKMVKQVLSNAATQQSSSNLRLNGSVGQAIIFTTNGNAISNQQGFWPGYQKVYISRSDNLETLGVKIYPNPTSEIITIESKEADLQQVQIFDLFGNEVLNIPVERGQSLVRVNISHLISASYFISIANKKGFLKTKLFKL